MYCNQDKSDVKLIFQAFYNLRDIQFSAKINELKSDNGGDYVNEEMTAFLKTTGITHNLSVPYIYECNALSEQMNRPIELMISSKNLDCAKINSRGRWTEVCSTTIYIGNCLPDSIFILKKLLDQIIFSYYPSNKYLYPLGSKYYI
jgi:hypothetical protein